MLKISFKDKKDCPAKTVGTFKDKETVVTLRGEMTLPKFWRSIPDDIMDWIDRHPSICTYESIVTSNLVMIVKGTSKCNVGDTFDPIIGERIAEARAKLKLYKFMVTLCRKLSQYYFGLVYGEVEVRNKAVTMVASGTIGGLKEAYIKYGTIWIKESEHLGKLMETL